MATFLQRMIGAARLDVHTYEEVEADRNATIQAAGVIVLAAAATGVGVLLAGKVVAVAAIILATLISEVIWAWLIYLIGTKLLPMPGTKADWGELFRTFGFAQSPAILRVFGIVPLLGPLVLLVTSIWVLVTTVIAARQALDYTSTLRAVIVCGIGWVVYNVIGFVLAMMLGLTPQM